MINSHTSKLNIFYLPYVESKQTGNGSGCGEVGRVVAYDPEIHSSNLVIGNFIYSRLFI